MGKTRKVLIPTLKLASDEFFDTSLTFEEQNILREKRSTQADVTRLLLQIIADAKQRNEMDEIPLLHLVSHPPLPDHYPCWEMIGTIVLSDFSVERTNIIRPPPPFIGGFFIDTVEF